MMDIVAKLISTLHLMDTHPDFSESVATMHVVEAIQTINDLRQQLAEQTSAEPICQIKAEDEGYWLDIECADYEHMKPTSRRKLYTAPPSIEVLLEALRWSEIALQDALGKFSENNDVQHDAIQTIRDALSSYKPTEGCHENN
jgi:hypothetical protein